MFLHPWHGIQPGEQSPELVDCIIEIPRGSHQKYELDKKTGMLRLDRVLYSAVFYPANYGFIPRTYCDDRDPLDIFVLGQEAGAPMCIRRFLTRPVTASFRARIAMTAARSTFSSWARKPSYRCAF